MKWILLGLLLLGSLQAEKIALITGMAGQDGSYLAEFLLSKGYAVNGIVRSSSDLTHLPLDKVVCYYCDISDYEALNNIIIKVQPDEIYHLAAQSDVKRSFDIPLITGDIAGLGTSRVLEACRELPKTPKIFLASSSEIFGASESACSELTPFKPKNPYGAAKLYGFWMGVIYRDVYGMFISNGIFFNHESPRRCLSFVTRKIASRVAEILSGREKYLELGNLDATRDWGFAPDYVECMWKILQLDHPADFVVGTGQYHSVREFLVEAFSYAGVTIGWRGAGVDEVGFAKEIDQRWKKVIEPGQILVKINPKYFRLMELKTFYADAGMAESVIQWKTRVTFDQLVKIMMDGDLERVGLEPIGQGVKILREHYPYIHKF